MLQNPHFVILRKKRVISAEIFNQNLSRVFFGDPLSLQRLRVQFENNRFSDESGDRSIGRTMMAYPPK